MLAGVIFLCASATQGSDMRSVVIENPIINSPFAEPCRHFRFDDEGITNEIVESRRVSQYFIPIATRDLLTESGSVFVQIGDENVHFVRCILDEIFGPENFVSLITFKKTSGTGTTYSPAHAIDRFFDRQDRQDGVALPPAIKMSLMCSADFVEFN